MKKMLATTATALVMSVTVALAATPATPIFNAPVKVGEGQLTTSGNRLAIDGTNIYMSFGTTRERGAMGTTRIATSTNSGATWNRSTILASEFDGLVAPRDNSVSVAVSNDPLYTGKKIVHAIWVAYEVVNGVIGDTPDLYYAYKADRPTLTGWSTPVKVTGNIFNDDAALTVSSSGSIHIVATRYLGGPNLVNAYITAASPDSSFTVTDLPFGFERPQIVQDPAGNISVVGFNGQGIQFSKKIGTANWTTPTTVATNPSIDYAGFAVADANTYYVSYFDGINSKLAFTTNAGTSWTQKTVVANQVVGNFWPNPVVAVTSAKVITYATVVNDSVKIYRSSDNGTTWSAPATVKGQLHPFVTLDSSNKAHIVTVDEEDGNWGNANLLWIKEK